MAAESGGGGGGGRGAGAGRRLRAWLLAQAQSGRFPGLRWEGAGLLRVPWQRARRGRGGGEAAALCQAWAAHRGAVPGVAGPGAAACKTRLRCALHKSPDFQELPERARLDGPRPYKVYRVLPAPPAGSQARKRGGAGRGAEQEEAPPQRRGSANEDRGGEGGGVAGEAPPPEMEVVVESAQPLPPARGEAALGLRLLAQGAPCWQGWLPPGEYLLAPPTPPGPAPPPLLPRLVLRPRPSSAGSAPPSPLGAGLLLSSSGRGLFLRPRPGAGPGLRCHAPHGHALREGELLLAFDASRFRREVAQHRAGLGPRPRHRVTLEMGPPPRGDAPPGLVLQLEQAFAQPLLDGDDDAAAAAMEPPRLPPLQA